MNKLLFKIYQTIIIDTPNYRITHVCLLFIGIIATILLKSTPYLSDFLLLLISIVIYTLMILRYKYFNYHLMFTIFIALFVFTITFNNELLLLLTKLGMFDGKEVSLKDEYMHIYMIIISLLYFWSFKNKSNNNLINLKDIEKK